MATEVNIKFNYTDTSSSLSQSSYSKTDTWTPVASSVTFTASSKLSRGGYGHFADFYDRPLKGNVNDGALLDKTLALDADAITNVTYASQTTLAGSTLSFSTYSKTDTWTPVASSVTFTASSKLSRGGYGHFADFYDRPIKGNVNFGGLLLKIGTLKSLAGVVHTTGATLSGVGTITATLNRIVFTSATLSGVGTLNVTFLPLEFGVATLSGTGTVTAFLTEIHNSPTSSLSGTGSISAILSTLHVPTATLSGTGFITASVTRSNISDGWVESGMVLSGTGNFLLASRFPSNEYLDGTNDFKVTPAKRIPLASEAFISFKIWDTTTTWPAESSFTGTLAGSTFQNSTMLSFARHHYTGARRSPGTLNIVSLEMDGSTNVAITAYAKWLSSISANGHTNWTFNPERIAIGTWEGDGETTWSMSGDLTHFIQLNMDGATDVSITPMWIWGGEPNMDGSTSVSITTNQTYAGHLSITGDTSVHITGEEEYLGSIFADGVGSMVFATTHLEAVGNISAHGSTAWSLATGVYVTSTVVIDQMDQEMTALLTLIWLGEVDISASSSMTPSSSYYPLGTDYVYFIKDNVLEDGDFTPITTGYFTLSGKTSRSGTGDVGRLIDERAFGLSRADTPLVTNSMQFIDREEWVRFPFEVDSEIDFTQISTAFGFSLGGGTALAGDGIIGRDLQDYVTLSILTNVRNTATNLEKFWQAGNPSVDATQVVTELLFVPVAAARNTQTVAEIIYLANLAVIDQNAVEALHTANPDVLLNELAIEVLVDIHANAWATQITAEMLATGNPDVRVTLITAEILTLVAEANSNALIQQDAVETIGSGEPHALVNSEALEVINNNNDPNADVNSTAIETIHNNASNARIQIDAVEAVCNGVGNARLNSLVIEMLVRAEFDPEVASLVNNPHYHV